MTNQQESGLSNPSAFLFFKESKRNGRAGPRPGALSPGFGLPAFQEGSELPENERNSSFLIRKPGEGRGKALALTKSEYESTESPWKRTSAAAAERLDELLYRPFSMKRKYDTEVPTTLLPDLGGSSLGDKSTTEHGNHPAAPKCGKLEPTPYERLFFKCIFNMISSGFLSEQPPGAGGRRRPQLLGRQNTRRRT